MAFCAGADLKTLEQEYAGGSEPDELVDALHRVFGRLERLELPVLAAVHGYCFGGGLELMLTADLCIAAAEAYRIGLVNRVVPAATLVAEALSVAAAIAGQAPLAVRKIKEATNGGLELELEAGLALER